MGISLAERLKIDDSKKYEPIFYNESCLVSRLVSGMKKKLGELGYEKANGINGHYWMAHNGVKISCENSVFTYTCGNVEIVHDYSNKDKGEDIKYIAHLGDENGSIVLAHIR